MEDDSVLSPRSNSGEERRPAGMKSPRMKILREFEAAAA